MSCRLAVQCTHTGAVFAVPWRLASLTVRCLSVLKHNSSSAIKFCSPIKRCHAVEHACTRDEPNDSALAATSRVRIRIRDRKSLASASAALRAFAPRPFSAKQRSKGRFGSVSDAKLRQTPVHSNTHSHTSRQRIDQAVECTSFRVMWCEFDFVNFDLRCSFDCPFLICSFNSETRLIACFKTILAIHT